MTEDLGAFLDRFGERLSRLEQANDEAVLQYPPRPERYRGLALDERQEKAKRLRVAAIRTGRHEHLYEHLFALGVPV